MTQILRDYQQAALDQLRQGIGAGCLTQLLMAPTGAGKTTVASAIKQGAVAKGNRAIFIVDSLELVDQAVDRFMSDGLGVGVIQGQHCMTDYSQPVQVATIQTLGKRWGRIAEAMMPQLVVIDEAHCLHAAHLHIIKTCAERRVPVIGLSATPFRKGMGKVFDRMVTTATLASLTEQGYLVPAVCYAPNIPDLKGIKSSSGDWADEALAEVMGDAKIMGDVVDQWFKLAEGRQTIVFGCGVAHSRELARQFLRAGVPAGHIDGDTDPAERQQTIADYRAGKLRVLCNMAVLTKGFDAPETACIVLARPTKSLMLHYQMMGRGLRTALSKDNCLIIDHAGNCLRNGLPTDELPTELDMGDGENPDRRKEREEREEREPRPCPKCHALFKAAKCPACGFAPRAHEDVEWVDGKLVPLNTTAPTTKKVTPEQRLTIYAQFLGYARTRGMSDGWAYHKTREYTGAAPRNSRSVTPLHPSPEIASWIKHKNIQWAKSKARRAA